MNLNLQPPESRIYDSGATLDVHSVFRTLQGEGPFTGMPAIFVRLAGCNLQCPGCDTDYTSKRQGFPVGELAGAVQRSHAGYNIGLVVITGGEPFRQNIAPFVFELLSRGYHVQVETNGTLPIPHILHRVTEVNAYPSIRDSDQTGKNLYIVCSPKGSRINSTVLEQACCLKYVASARKMDDTNGLPYQALDLKLGLSLALPPLNWDRPIYIQPMDEQDEVQNAANLAACIKSSMVFGYILQLQTHKLLNLE